jgi:D-arabinose 1-dehydrogenase-like Zn-dependent alcohol dehydrogenase
VGAGAAAHRVIRQLRAQPGQYVGVVGAHGILGHMSIQIAKALGYVVVCLDPSYEMMPGKNIYIYIHSRTYRNDGVQS